jgi:hypothetical protein
MTSLIPPYGGVLIDLFEPTASLPELLATASALPSVQLSERSRCDLELLATGGFSPLDRFLGRADYERVVAEMRLANGTLFPIPITLPIADDAPVAIGKDVVLRGPHGEILAVMTVEEIYEWDRDDAAINVFGTRDTKHPLVAEMAGWGRRNISGPLRVISTGTPWDFRDLRRGANAAIVVLAFTIGTWALDFIAAGRGGILQTLASFTPTATLRGFERGLLRLDVVLVILILSILGFAIAATWLHLGRSIRARIAGTSVLSILAMLAIGLVLMLVRVSFDVSENRRNSFSPSDECALSSIHAPLTITVFLSSEDPRMMDFENNILLKLRRSMPDVNVIYPLAGRSGLFETTRATVRSSTASAQSRR